MWKQIVALFRSGGPLQEAYDEAILMLQASHDMFDHAVAALHAEGALETDIYKARSAAQQVRAARSSQDRHAHVRVVQA